MCYQQNASIIDSNHAAQVINIISIFAVLHEMRLHHVTAVSPLQTSIYYLIVRSIRFSSTQKRWYFPNAWNGRLSVFVVRDIPKINFSWVFISRYTVYKLQWAGCRYVNVDLGNDGFCNVNTICCHHLLIMTITGCMYFHHITIPDPLNSLHISYSNHLKSSPGLQF